MTKTENFTAMNCYINLAGAGYDCVFRIKGKRIGVDGEWDKILYDEVNDVTHLENLYVLGPKALREILANVTETDPDRISDQEVTKIVDRALDGYCGINSDDLDL